MRTWEPSLLCCSYLRQQTCNPKRNPMKTNVLLKRDFAGFSLKHNPLKRSLCGGIGRESSTDEPRKIPKEPLHSFSFLTATYNIGKLEPSALIPKGLRAVGSWHGNLSSAQQWPPNCHLRFSECCPARTPKSRQMQKRQGPSGGKKWGIIANQNCPERPAGQPPTKLFLTVST